MNICSICGQAGEMDSSGPGPHQFHSACVNGAFNFLRLTREIGGDTKRNMMFWPNAEKAGVSFPFPPFREISTDERNALYDATGGHPDKYPEAVERWYKREGTL